MLTSNASDQAQIRSQAAGVLSQRSAAMSALIAQEPAAALALGFPQDVLEELQQYFPTSAGQLESYGTFEGPAEVRIYDNPQLNSGKLLAQIQTATGKLSITFAQPPGRLKCGDVIQVAGMRNGDRVAASSTLVTGTAALTCSTTGVQNTAVILVTFPGVPAPFTKSYVENVFFGTGTRSFDGFLRDASYNKASATGAVFGWYPLSQSYTCDQDDLLMNAAIAAADPDIDYTLYNRIFIVFPPSTCSWAGLGSIGCWTISTAEGNLPASVSWLVAQYMDANDEGVMLITHEGGHNLGLHHSRSRDFGADSMGSPGIAGTISEYGDRFATLGYWNLMHYNAEHKRLLNWLPSAAVPDVTAAGSYTLLPYGSGDTSVRGLKVARGTGSNDRVWLEFRQPVGQYESQAPNQQIYTGLLGHLHDTQTVGGGTDLIDFTRAGGNTSFLDPALTGAYVDPYTNLRLAVSNVSSAGATVDVSYGTLTCARANPAVTISPAATNAYQNAKSTFTVTVKNNDNAGCQAASFALSSTQPANWIASILPASLSLSPGQSGTATLEETNSGAIGVSPVTVAASSDTYQGSATANVTVQQAPPKPVVTVATDKASYAARAAVGITATVKVNTLPAGAATVIFTLTKPNGVETKTVISKSNGTAAWSYRLGVKDPAGAYRVTATATLNGVKSDPAPAALFAVQ